MKKLTLLLFAAIVFIGYLTAQTTYTESPVGYVCGSYDSGGNGIRFRVWPTPIDGNVATFRIRKSENNACSGNDDFGATGTMRLREGSISGTVVASCSMSSCGGSDYIDLSETLTFTSGSKNYYVTIFAAGFNYWAGPITISANTVCPDLEVTSYSISPTRIHPGETLNINCTVENTGNETANSSTLYYYLDVTPGTFSVPSDNIGSDYVRSLSPNSTSNESMTQTFSPTATPGTYYIKWKADATSVIDECSEGNNIEYRTLHIDPTEGSNLRLNSSIDIDPTPVIYDESATFTANIYNSAPGVWEGDLRLNLLDNNGTTIDLIDEEAGVSISSEGVYTFSHTSNSVSTPVGDYQVEVAYRDVNSSSWYSLDEGAYTNPQPFTIANAPPVISVITPVHGYAYPKYDTNGDLNVLNITWTSSNVPGNIGIELVDENENHVFDINGGAPNTGSYAWQIDQSISSGNYKILLYPSGTTGYPFYSGVFKIIDQPVLTSPADDYTFLNPPSSINYQWNPNNLAGLANYEIRLRDITTNTVLLNYVATQNDNAHVHTYSYQQDHEYRWVIRAKAGTNNATIESVAFDFEVDAGSPFLQLSQPMSISPNPPTHDENAGMEAIVTNNGSASWTGTLAFQLINIAEGTSIDMINPVSATLDPGESQTLTRPTSPITSDPGLYQIRVQQQNSGSDEWITVDGNGHSNPLDFEILCPDVNITNTATSCHTDTYSIDVSFAGASGRIYDVYAYDGTQSYSGAPDVPSGTYTISGIPENTDVTVKVEDNEFPYDCFDEQYVYAPNCGAATLVLSSPITVSPNPLTHDSPGSFSADVINAGAMDWSGNLAMHMVVDGMERDLDRDDGITIAAGQVYTALDHATNSVMTEPGTYDLWVVHQTDGTGNWSAVDAGDFANPIAVTIEAATGGLTLTSPNGGQSYEAGQLLPISWTTSGAIDYVTIKLESYPQQSPPEVFLIAEGIANTGAYNDYYIPVCALGDYRVKIYETDNESGIYDFSDAAFAITIDPLVYSLAITSPSGGEIYSAGDPYPQISWASTDNVGSISIELVNELGITKAVVADGIPDSSPFNTDPNDQWGDVFANNLAAGSYRFKIYNTGCGTVVGESELFTVNSTYSGECDCTISNPPASQQEAHEAVTYLCENCIIDNPPDGDVHPSDPIIKQDLAKITFLALFGDPTTATYADNFPVPFFDMQGAEPYQRYGKVLSYLEYGDAISPFNRRFANYRPASNITRGQVCKVYCEAFNITCDENFTPFTDVPTTHPEFKYIAELGARGVVNTDNAQFRPDDFATREDAFIMLWRIHDITECGDCMDDAILASEVEDGTVAEEAFFDPGNYTPENLGRHPGFSDANFDSYSATGFFMADRGMPLVFGHSYNSYLTELPDELFPQRPLGNGWLHTYNSYIVKVPGWSGALGTQEDVLAVVWSDGSMHFYEDNAALTKITEGNYDIINYSSGNDSYTIKKKNQVEFTFSAVAGAHDAPYMLTQIRDRNNNVIRIQYQVHNHNDKNLARVSLVTGTTGRTLTFSYYGNSDKIHTVTDNALGRSVEFYLGNPANLDDRLLWYKDTERHQTNYNYDDVTIDGYYLLNRITLPNGNFITNNYREKKLTSSVTNNTTTDNPVQTDVDWSLNGATLGTTSMVSTHDGFSTREYTYTTNDIGKITNIDAPTNDAIVLYEDPDNPTLPTTITVAGLTTTYAYDDMGNVTDVDQEENVSHDFAYNGNNDITLYRNPRQNETTFIYGDGINLTRIEAPIGTTQITYYPYGLVHTVTNPENIVVSYEYDTHGNVERMTAPGGIQSNAEYDLGSRLEAFYNPNNQRTTYAYDDRNFVTDVTHHLPNHPDYQLVSTHYDYDGNGNMTDITNAHGRVTHMNYDYFDLLEDETFGSATRAYEYDVEGKLRKITKADGTQLIYSYLQTKGLLESDGYATYGYDSKHRLRTVTKDGKTITFNYDDLNRITSTVYDDQTVQYQYDDNSNVVKIIYPDGNEADYTYDANDRMKTVKWNNELQAEYFYLLDGRLDHADLANGVTTQYFYDAAGRVDSIATVQGTNVICAYGFEMDPLGNHQVENKTEPFGYSTLASVTEDDYAYNLNRNEIQAGGGKSFTHDNNGNMQQVSGARNLTYGWDAHDMLTSVSGDFNASYSYDGLGHRRAAEREGVTTNYVLDILGMSRILIDMDASGNPQNYYLYGLGMVARVKPNNDIRYYHYDFRGSTVAITDENANITHQYAYDEYGAALQIQEEDPNPFRFVGGFGVMQESDHLLFMRARYYDVEIGRFLSEDPIWSDNLYAYAGGNPVGNIDPMGLSDWQAGSVSMISFTGNAGEFHIAYATWVAQSEGWNMTLGGEGVFYHLESGPIEVDVGKIGAIVDLAPDGIEAGFEACAAEAEANLVCTPFGSLKGTAGLCANAKLIAKADKVGVKAPIFGAELDLTDQCYDIEILDVGYDDVVHVYETVDSEIQKVTNSRFGGVRFINELTRSITGRPLQFNTKFW